ncbi:PAS domain-containing protein [Croceibacterium xixiisoli]|uniref:PAS domain-containing protein n=1 Tax=Croceibacterium xixiisoli TaxID=1476466 RepID=UPI002E257A9D|nr:PAS domain-containing protein [Croceibacterium xixiisoli]
MAVLRKHDPDALADDDELTAIVRLVADLCHAPIAMITLVEQDRQRFLARVGIAVEETPRSTSFCAHAMMQAAVMEVPDATQDGRFSTNPLVTGEPHIRFYAGQPLLSAEGAALGALCVIDTDPRPAGLTDLQRNALTVLAQAAMRRLWSRRDELDTARLEQRSTHQLRALADSMPAIAWSCDNQGNIDYFNRRLIEFTGSATYLYGTHVHPEDFDRSYSLWQASLASGQPYECEHRVRRADGSYRWMMTRAEPVRDDSGAIVRWFGTATDIDDIHRLAEHRDLLARELSHRIKNIFAVVAALISLSARKQPEFRAFSEEVNGSIRALGRAHDYVRPDEGQRRNSLHGMLDDLFIPYGSGGESRVRVHGDDVTIAARAATPLALVFHELATNSAKYGALSAEDGVIDLTIRDGGDDNPDMLLLRWQESGGPPPPQDVSNGFGSRLVEMSITGQLQGSWQRSFEPDGMICELTIAKAALSA